MGRVTVRLPDDVHRSLRAEAARKGESLNQLIVEAVSSALEPQGPRASKTPLQKEVARIKRLLGDIVGEVDYSHFPEHLRPRPDLPDTETLTDALGERLPPLSAQIIKEREEDTR